MKNIKLSFFGVLGTALSFLSCDQPPKAELAIENVNVFDAKNKTVLAHKTILINADTIAAILNGSQGFEAQKTIAGNGRLLVPGFIDTHTHLKNVYGVYENSEVFRGREKSMDLNRAWLSDTYLKYGTTTIVDMGQPAKTLKQSLEWQMNPEAGFPNMIVSGGALISNYDEESYINHAGVGDGDAAKNKVKEYAAMGLTHLKLYSWLNEPEMKAVLAEAQKQNLIVSGHIDRNGISIPKAMEYGLQNFEHLLSLPSSIINEDDYWDVINETYGLKPIESVDEWVAVVMFFFDYIENDAVLSPKMEALLDKMAAENATLSTAIQQMGAVANKTFLFTSFGGDEEQEARNMPNYTEAHLAKVDKAYNTMMQVLKRAHDKGIKIRIGTDCRRGGEALLSELMLLSEANFTMEDILQIATINGAEAMNVADKYGSIEVGKKADLVLFEKNPFEDYKNVLSEKLVIKGGHQYMKTD